MNKLTIELPDTVNVQLQQHNISEQQLTALMVQFVRLYLSKPQMWELLRDSTTVFEQTPISKQVDFSFDKALHHFLTMDISHFTPPQRHAYNRACALLKRGRQPDEPRILGLFTGLVDMADDFDAPLPNEIDFWGSQSDKYGINLGL